MFYASRDRADHAPASAVSSRLLAGCEPATIWRARGLAPSIDRENHVGRVETGHRRHARPNFEILGGLARDHRCHGFARTDVDQHFAVAFGVGSSPDDAVEAVALGLGLRAGGRGRRESRTKEDLISASALRPGASPSSSAASLVTIA